MNKKILLILLVSASMYGRISISKRILYFFCPCFKKKKVTPLKLEHKHLHRVKEQLRIDSLEDEDPIIKGYKPGYRDYMAGRVIRFIPSIDSLLSEEEMLRDVMEEKKDRNKLYVPVDSKD